MTEPAISDEHVAAGRQAILTRNPMPELKKLREAGQRRRRRQQAAGVVTGVAVIAAVGLTVAQGTGPTVTAQNPARAPVAGPFVATPAAVPAASTICTTLPSGGPQTSVVLSTNNCSPTKPLLVARTSNNGRTWSAVTLPKEAGCPTDLRAKATTIAAHTFVMCGLITRDDGRTWSRVPANGSDLRQIPAGWPVMAPDNRFGLVAVDPSTGQAHPLAAAPAGAAPSSQQEALLPASDGSYWTGTSTGPTGSTLGWVSRDRGLTWTALGLSLIDGVKNTEVSSADGITGFALYYRPGLAAVIYETTDGGVNWREAMGGQVPAEVTGIEVRGDGALLGFNDQSSSGPNSLYVSKNGGRTFEALGSAAYGVLSRDALGTYILSDNSSARAMSVDGKTFSPIPLPAGAKR